jgi:NAD(P)-dependent dehydrogenase (short-subunit alcohol dehydrogenase family)
MPISFEGRVVIVTGAGGGVGRAHALAFAARGAKVLVNDLGGDPNGQGEDAAPAQKVVDEIKRAGGDAIANFGSVADFENGLEMVRQCVDAWGRVDALVCNAGILRDKAVHNITEQDWDLVFDVHVKGSFNLIHHAWPLFRQQQYGRIVMTSSSSGIYGNFGQTNYGGAKAAMMGMMNVLKLEGLKYNIGVNLILPGAATRMTENLMPAEALEGMQPEHVSPAVLYLSSEECKDTGLMIEAAGGHFNRAVVVQGPQVSTGGEVATVDWVHEHWSEITSLEGAKPRWNIAQSLEEFEAERAKQS